MLLGDLRVEGSWNVFWESYMKKELEVIDVL